MGRRVGYNCLLKDEAGYDGALQTVMGLDMTVRPGFVLPQQRPKRTELSSLRTQKAQPAHC